MVTGYRVWLLVMAASLLVAPSSAQEAAPGTPAPLPAVKNLQQIYVPADDPASWPEGDWIPVAQQDLRNLLTRPEPTAPPPAAFEKAVYRARLAGATLVGGTLEAVARLRSNEPQFLDLGQPSLAISRLHWSGRQAVWGLSDDSRPLLRVDEDKSVLSGRWSLAGRRVFSDVEFELRVPPATVSQLELELPATRELTLEGGLISQVVDSERPNWKTWKIDLGRRTSCRLKVAAANTAHRNLPRELQVSQTTTYSFVDSDLRIQADITIQSAAGTFDTLEVVAPPDMTFSSITAGNDTVLAAWRKQEEQRSVLVVDVSGITLSPGSRIRLRGQLPLRAGTRQGLPRLGLVGGRWLQLRRQVRVVSPLQLNDLDVTDSRLVNASMGIDSGAALEFDDLSTGSRVRLIVDTPEPQLSARVLGWVDWREADPQLRTDLQVESQTGSTYSVVCSLPADWEVTRVDAGSATPVAQWQTTWDPESGGNRLFVELRNALSPQSPLRISILARPRSGSLAESVQIPAILPLVSGEREVAMVLAAPQGVRFELPADSHYRVSDLAELVAARPELGEEFTQIGDSGLFVLRAADPGEQQWVTVLNAATGTESPTGTNGKAGEPSAASAGDAAPFDAIEEPIRASLKVVTLVAADRGRLCRNRAVLGIPPSSQARTMRVRLPEAARLLAAESALPVQVRDREVVVEIPAAGEPAEVTLTYHSPLSHSLLSGQARIPLPQWNGEPTTIGWQIELPGNFRLRFPTDGSTAVATASLSWSQRLLGPLGRALEGDVFWPFSAAAWRGLLGRQPAETAPTSADLQQMHRSLAGQHDSLSLAFWNIKAARRLGWVVLLVTLLVTAWPFQQERLLRPGWTFKLVLLGVAAALLSPELLAIPWGGFVVGAAVGALIPERWRSPRARVASEPSMIGSRMLPPLSATVGALLLWFGLAPAPSLGWQSNGEPAAGDTNLAPSVEGLAPLKVLIPLPLEEEPAQELPAYVYVERTAAERAFGRHIPPAPRYLLRSADYEVDSVDVPRPAVTARFDVVLLRPETETRVVLALTGVQFPDAQLCKLDGVPAPLLPHRSGDGVVVVVPPRTVADDGQTSSVQVELLCQPRPHADENAPRLAMGIPRIIASHLTIHSQEAGGATPAPLQIVHGGSLSPPAAEKGWRAALGGQGHLIVHPAEPAPVLRWQVPVSAGSVIEIHPMRLRVDSRLTFQTQPQWTQLGGRTLRLELPNGSIVREVRAEGLQSAQTHFNGRNPVLLDLLFAEDVAPELTVDISFDLPSSRTEDLNGVVIPALPFLPAADNAPLPIHRIGVAAAPGFRLTAADPEGMIPGTTGIDESQLPAWRGSRTARTADATYQLSAARSLIVPLEAIVPAVSTSVRQTLTVQSSSVEWTALLQMNIRDAPLMLHRLVVDPRVNVRQVSVDQEAVDRLASWSRTAPDQLVLFLKEELSGPQTIELKGSLAVEDRSDFVIPSLQVDGASLTEPPEVVIRHAAEIPIVVAAEDGTVVAGEPAPASTENVVQLATLNLDPTLPPLRVQRRRREPGIDIEQMTVIDSLQQGEAHWTRFLRIDTSRAPQQTLELDVGAIPPAIQLAASVPTTEEIGTDTTRLNLDMAAADSDAVDVTITGRSPLPSGMLPDVRVSGASLPEHLIVVLEGVDIAVEGGSDPVDVDSLSEWSRENLDLLERPAARLYRVQGGAVPLSPPADAAADAWLQRLDAAVWLQADGRRRGVSVAEITALRPTRVEFALPEGMTLLFGQLEGRDISPLAPAVFEVPGSQMSQRLVLWWTDDSPADAGLPLPAVRNLAGATARAVLFGSEQQYYLFEDPAETIRAQQLLEDAAPQGAAETASPIWQALRDAGIEPQPPGEAVSDSTTHVVRLAPQQHTIPVHVIDRQLAGVMALLLAAGAMLALWFAVGPWTERFGEAARSASGLPALVLLGAAVWLLGWSGPGFVLLVMLVAAWVADMRRPVERAENPSQLQAAS